MITNQEFFVLAKYQDIFDAWAQGRSIQVTRALYQDVEPIVKKHTNLSFTITCSACNNKLLKYAHHLYYEYVNQPKPKRQKNEKGKQA